MSLQVKQGFADIAKAIVPEAIGVAALVPECWVVQALELLMSQSVVAIFLGDCDQLDPPPPPEKENCGHHI